MKLRYVQLLLYFALVLVRVIVTDIDAVGLIDKENKTQWAKKAEASSTYATK